MKKVVTPRELDVLTGWVLPETREFELNRQFRKWLREEALLSELPKELQEIIEKRAYRV